MDIQMPDSVRDTIREALAKDAIFISESITSENAFLAQVAYDITQAQEYVEEVLERIAEIPKAEMHYGANRITTILDALNSLAQAALHTYARSAMGPADVAALSESATRAAVAARWLSDFYDGLFDKASLPLNKVAFPHIAADIIAAQRIAEQPKRIRDILAMRDLIRALGHLESEVRSARIHQPDSLREPVAVHAYYAERVGHAVVLGDAVADRFASSDIEGFGTNAYRELTLNLRFAQSILRPELPVPAVQGGELA